MTTIIWLTETDCRSGWPHWLLAVQYSLANHLFSLSLAHASKMTPLFPFYLFGPWSKVMPSKGYTVGCYLGSIRIWLPSSFDLVLARLMSVQVFPSHLISSRTTLAKSVWSRSWACSVLKRFATEKGKNECFSFVQVVPPCLGQFLFRLAPNEHNPAENHTVQEEVITTLHRLLFRTLVDIPLCEAFDQCVVKMYCQWCNIFTAVWPNVFMYLWTEGFVHPAGVYLRAVKWPSFLPLLPSLHYSLSPSFLSHPSRISSVYLYTS